MEMVEESNPDLVVLATGANPRRPRIPGVWGKNVVLANDIIIGKAKLGNRIVVIGAGIVGMEVALQLAEEGRRVSVTEEFCLGGVVSVEVSFYRELRNRIIDLGVQFFENSPAKEIREDGVYIAFHDDLVFLKADTVALAVGVEPNDDLGKKLKRAGHRVFMVGDCVQARDAMRAIHEGAEVALQVESS
jgi:2-enoate reductase